MNKQQFPEGWDEQRVRELLAMLEARSDSEWAEADEIAAGMKEVVLPDAGAKSVRRIRSPRLVQRRDADTLAKDVTAEGSGLDSPGPTT